MNERIKELVGQAKFMAEETINKKISANAELNAFAEKFAELIISECIEQCTDNDSNDEWDKGIRWAANQIKEHFGVEE